MPKLTEKFLKERYESDEKYFTIYDQYRPNYNKSIITDKFYSTEIKDFPLDESFYENLKRAKMEGPKDKFEWPETENQWYGWFSEPLVEIDRTDGRYWHPAICYDTTKHELKVKYESRHEKKFTGIPFKL